MSYYAGFWIRFFAILLDSVIFSLLWLACLVAYFSMVHDISIANLEDVDLNDLVNLSDKVFIVLMAFLIFTVLPILCLSSKYQSTPGKAMLSIYVGDKDGNRISTLRSAIRYIMVSILYPTCIFLIDALVLIFSKEKASLHDKICRTRVFRK